MKDIELVIKTRHWSLESHVNQHILYNETSAKLGWQRIVLIAKNKAAEDFLAMQGLVMARQNYHLQGIPLHLDDDRKASLVFYRHNPLHQITLDWILPTTKALENQPVFSVRIKPISAAKAWFFMLKAVAKRDKDNGDNASKIYRLTRARQKRSGRSHALRKLVQTYQPLLQHQLTSCEPFNYWRLHNEPLTRDALLKYYKPNQSKQVVSLTNKNERICDELWYHVPVAGCIYTKQFEQLLQAATNIAEQQNSSIVYWDHDYINERDERILPHFKPDWSPDLLLTQDYIGPAYAIKGKLLNQSLKNSAWSDDHYIRLINAITCGAGDKLITHVPVILEHHTNASIADDRHAQIELARQQVVCDWLSQQGDQLVSFSSAFESGVRKVNFALAKNKAAAPLVSIIVPTRNSLDITRTCINSILEKTRLRDFEIIIVDNQSDCAKTLAWFEEIQQHSQIKILRYDAPFNYSAINNYAVKNSSAELICLLNNDTEVINEEWLDELAQQAQRPGVGCVGAKLYYPDNTVQHAGVVLGLWGLAGHAHKSFTRHSQGYCQRLSTLQNFSAVTAACLMIKKSTFNAIGGFNENELKVAFNDVDLCLKAIAAGYRNIWTPYAELYHYESKTRGKEDSPEKKAREQKEINYMQKKWASFIAHDPAYSPNLTRLQEDFGINLEPTFNLRWK